MRTDIKLSHKGLILVCVPLVFELTFVLALAAMLRQAESAIMQETRARTIQACVTRLNLSLMDAGDAATGYSISKAYLFVKEFHEGIKSIPDDLQTLHELTRDNQGQAVLAMHCSDLAKSMIDRLSKGLTLLQNGSELEGLSEIEGWKQLRDEFRASARSIFQEQQKIVSASPATEASTRARVEIALGAGVAFNIGLALWLAAFFYKGTMERLGTLMSNSLLLANQQPLKAKLGGRDEIAHLDRVFHEMADKLAEAARKERAIVDNAMDVICSIGSDGRFTKVSPAAKKVWGYAPEELLGTKYSALVASDDKEVSLDAARKSLQGVPIETMVRRKDGAIVHMLWSAYWSPTEEALFCVAHDISERKRAEQLLKASEERVRQIIDSMPVGLIVINEEGIIEMTNPAVSEMFEYEGRRLKGKHILMLFHNARENTREQFMNVLFRDAIGKIIQRDVIKKSEKPFAVELSLKSISAQGGRRFLLIMLDITERRELERLKQEFVAMVSHDLRTPLTAIRAFLALVGEGFYGQLTENGQIKATHADQSAARLISLVNELLDMEKLESGRFQMELNDIPISDVIERSADSVRAFAEDRGIFIITQASDELVCADGDRLVQVLVNLLSNAIKYSPKGEAIRVTVEEMPKYVEVRVTDKGRGIPVHLKEAIFERFKQVEIKDAKEKGGSGLGLAISKAMIEQQGGIIGVDSEEGKGSTFWFRIPTARAAAYKVEDN